MSSHMKKEETEIQILHEEGGRRLEVCLVKGQGVLSKEDWEEALPADRLAEVSTVVFSCPEELEADSVSLVNVFHLVNYVKAQGCEFDWSSLPDNYERLYRILQPPRDSGATKGRENMFQKAGDWAYGIIQEIQELAAFSGEWILSLCRLVRGNAVISGKEFGHILFRVTASALPIVSLISFLVGLIIAFLGAVVLGRFGAEFAIAYLVGYGMLREMGAIMTAVIMAGRTGAAFAAEIGSMKVSEELDALETFGISPMDYIVLPRLVALFIAMPFLTVYANVIGILSGYLVAALLMDIPAPMFFSELNFVVGFSDLFLGLFKALVFGVLIGTAGCFRGLQCGGGTDAVGVAATKAVVTGITLIILANALIDWAAASFSF